MGIFISLSEKQWWSMTWHPSAFENFPLQCDQGGHGLSAPTEKGKRAMKWSEKKRCKLRKVKCHLWWQVLIDTIISLLECSSRQKGNSWLPCVMWNSKCKHFFFFSHCFSSLWRQDLKMGWTIPLNSEYRLELWIWIRIQLKIFESRFAHYWFVLMFHLWQCTSGYW